MSSPLVWKCWQLSNYFYEGILRYQTFYRMDTKTQRLNINKGYRQSFLSFFSMFIVLMILILMTFLLIKSSYLQHINLKPGTMMAYSATILFATVCISLQIEVFCFSETISLFYNTMLRFYNDISPTRPGFNHVQMNWSYVKLFLTGLSLT